jgi:ABC-type sugar transport systems, permease components
MNQFTIRRRATRLLPYLLIGASIVYIALLLGYPFLQGAWLSFTKTSLLAPQRGEFVGFDNYTRLIESAQLWETLWTTLVYTAGSVVGAVGLGFAVALLLNYPFRGRGVVRSIIAIPWAAPVVAAALIFAWIFDNQYGIASWTVERIVEEAPVWFLDPAWAMPTLILITIWKIFPISCLVLLAALQGVPEEQYEAARMDGATPLNVFKNVTFPNVLPTFAVLLLLVTIWSFRRFEIIWLLTAGGPLRTTNTLVIDVYREAFRHHQLGLASALGIIGLLLAIVATGVYFVAQRRMEAADAN